MKLFKLVAILILLGSAVASAQVGRTGVPFLLIAPGARAAGMGEAFIAIADDATSVHWNPAGLGHYPLTGSWLNVEGSSQDTIQTVVLVKNNLPENNYRQYDIWGIINNKLAKWNGAKWMTGSRQNLKAGQSLKSLIVRYTGLGEDQAGPYIDKLGRSNNVVPPESIDSLKNRLLPVLPANYSYKEKIEYGFEKLNKAWLELRLDVDGFRLVRSEIETALKDSVPSTPALDKIAFGFDRAIAAKGDRSLWIPYNLLLPDSLTSLASDDENIYVGTNAGFFRLQPSDLRWSSFTSGTDSTMVSNRITSISRVGRHGIYVGTDKGLMTFTGRAFKPFGPQSGLPAGPIKAIAAKDDRDVWAAAESDLFHYDGLKWENAVEKQFSVGETLIKATQKFYGELGAAHSDSILAEVSRANSSLGDTVAAGRTVRLPYSPGFKGEITALGVDQKGRLWIGTNTGISFFDGESFHLFGYKFYQADQPTTVSDVARRYVPDGDSAKVANLSAIIKEYNGLNSDSVQAGAKLLVFANALGTEISAIEPVSGKKTMVATGDGVVEYNDGKWARMHVSDLDDSHVNSIYSHSGEMWMGSRDKLSIFAAPKRKGTFMHSNYLVALASDIYYEYFSLVFPTRDWGTFGFGVTFLSLGNQQRTDEIGNALGGFYTYEMALTLSYGTKLMNNLYGGLSARYINSHLSDAGAGRERGSGVGYSFAVDAGLMYDVSKRLTLATTITNLGPNIAYIDADQADPLPRKMAVGFAYKLVNTPYNRLSFVGEATKLLVDLNHSLKTEVEEIIPHVGLEYWYSNYVALRGGYIYDKIGVQKYFTLGASLQLSDYSLDFAYIPPSNEEFNRLGNTLRFSMNVGF